MRGRRRARRGAFFISGFLLLSGGARPRRRFRGADPPLQAFGENFRERSYATALMRLGEKL
jgi:hypothetical protein